MSKCSCAMMTNICISFTQIRNEIKIDCQRMNPFETKNLTKSLKASFKETIFKKMFYSLFNRCQRITITIYLAAIFTQYAICDTFVLSLVTPQYYQKFIMSYFGV